MSLNAEIRVSSDVDLKKIIYEWLMNVFKVLFHLLKPHIEKRNTRIKRAISAEERLAATLRFLATERSFHGLKFTAVISSQSLGRTVPENCKFIYRVLKEQYLKVWRKCIFNYYKPIKHRFWTGLTDFFYSFVRGFYFMCKNSLISKAG